MATAYEADRSGTTIKHDSGVDSVAISAKGYVSATGGADGRVRVFSFLGTEYLICPDYEGSLSGPSLSPGYPTHEGSVSGLCIGTSSDGNILLSSGYDDGTIHVLNATTAVRRLPDLQDPDSGIRNLAADDRLDVVATVNLQGHLRIWDIWKQTVRWDKSYGDTYPKVAVSGNGKRVACAIVNDTAPGGDDPFSVRKVYRGSTVFIYDENGAGVSSFRSERQIKSLALGRDGTRVLTGDAFGAAHLYSDAGKKLCSFEEHTHQIESVSMNEDCTVFLTGSRDGTARLWTIDQRDGSPVSVAIIHHANWVNAVAISLDGSRIVTGSDDGEAYIYDVPSYVNNS